MGKLFSDVAEAMLHILMKAGYVFRKEDIEKIPAHKKHLVEMIGRYQRTPRCLMELCRKSVVRQSWYDRELSGIVGVLYFT